MTAYPPANPSTETPSDVGPDVLAALREEFKTVRTGDWCHQFDLDDAGQFQPSDNLRYRHGVLVGLFRSLFRDRSVLVLDETTGLFPLLIAQAGARAVTANHVNPTNCQLARRLAAHFGVPVEVRNQALIRFEKPNVLVDIQDAGRHEFLFAQNRIWNLYAASGHSFDDVVEACAHYVSGGLVFDWTDARWANPPAAYTRDNFHAALRRRFEFVLGVTDWLTLALGRLPEAEAAPADGV